jgi:MFS superfamily sulfate permease-like transporter
MTSFLGTYAIVSLMVISSLNKYNGVLYPLYDFSETESNSTHIETIVNTTSSSKPVHRLANARSEYRPVSGVTVDDDDIEYLSNDPVKARVMIAMSMALLTGLLHILFAILHVGVVTKYLSDTIVNGFTIGAAYHVVTSQISTLLGIKLGENHLPFVLIGVILTFVDV